MPSTTTLHIALQVRDLAASVAFYERLFGHAPAKRFDDYAKFEVAEPPLILSLNPGSPDAPAPRLAHAGLRFEDLAQLETIRTRLAAAGLEGRVEEDTVCCYARSDKSWYADPDGNEWELYVNHGDEAVHSAPGPAAAAVTQSSADPGGGCCAPAPDGGSSCC